MARIDVHRLSVARTARTVFGRVGSLPWVQSRVLEGAAATAVAAAMIVLQAAPAEAQRLPAGDCLQFGAPIFRVPELISQNGILKGTIVLGDQLRRLTLGPGNCAQQYLRHFEGVDAVTPPVLPGSPQPAPSADTYADPVPGPTLRARVGDIVELTFLNQVNPLNYPNSLDRGDSNDSCDQFTVGSGSAGPAGYPANANDTFPNCFHGSSTANIHFHGTHTNPNSTGDNVFLNIRPTPFSGDQPMITEDSVRSDFDAFFSECEKNLHADVLSQFPSQWSDATSLANWQQQQKTLLQAYDAGTSPYFPPAKPVAQQLWPADQEELDNMEWPQYYVGAYPYCFQLPEYTDSSWPPYQAGGLNMGQAPGTHWYHAHKHGSTALNVSNGMTGAFVIEGDYDDDLNRFYGDTETPLWTRTQPVLVMNELGGQPNLARNIQLGPLSFSVNGRLQPTLMMRPGEVQMWRIVNSSPRSFANFLPPTGGFEWMQLAQDGVQLGNVNYQNSKNQAILLAPGNRADILIKAPTTAPSTPYAVRIQQVVSSVGLSGRAPRTLMSVVVSGTAPENPNRTMFIPHAPRFPPFLADIKDSEIKGTKTLKFNTLKAGDKAQHTIDNKQFSGEIGASVLLNSVEEWKVENYTNANTSEGVIDHPFHIHINPFQVVEVFDPNELLADASGQPLTDPATGKPAILPNGKPAPKYVFDDAAFIYKDLQCLLDPRGNPENWKPCEDTWGKNSDLIWWDVFPIPAGTVAKDATGATLTDGAGDPIIIPGYFKMRSRFVDFMGQYVLHCHILAHEDRGMMTIVAVTDNMAASQHH